MPLRCVTCLKFMSLKGHIFVTIEYQWHILPIYLRNIYEYHTNLHHRPGDHDKNIYSSCVSNSILFLPRKCHFYLQGDPLNTPNKYICMTLPDLPTRVTLLWMKASVSGPCLGHSSASDMAMIGINCLLCPSERWYVLKWCSVTTTGQYSGVVMCFYAARAA